MQLITEYVNIWKSYAINIKKIARKLILSILICKYLRIALFWSFSILLFILVVCNLQDFIIQTDGFKPMVWCYTLVVMVLFYHFVGHLLDLWAANAFPSCWHYLHMYTYFKSKTMNTLLYYNNLQHYYFNLTIIVIHIVVHVCGIIISHTMQY